MFANCIDRKSDITYYIGKVSMLTAWWAMSKKVFQHRANSPKCYFTVTGGKICLKEWGVSKIRNLCWQKLLEFALTGIAYGKHNNSVTVSDWITHHNKIIYWRQHRITLQRFMYPCKSLCTVTPNHNYFIFGFLRCDEWTSINGPLSEGEKKKKKKKETKKITPDAGEARVGLAKQICFYRATLVNYFRPDS